MSWQCNSSNVCTNPIPYHVYDSKGYGSWFSDHQARISMRDGPKNQVCIFDMECNAHEQTNGTQPLSQAFQKAKHACKWDAILGM